MIVMIKGKRYKTFGRKMYTYGDCTVCGLRDNCSSECIKYECQYLVNVD